MTSRGFDRIVVIYNPLSTGDAPQMAEELHADLAERLPEVPVVMRPTEHAGHARDLAREAAQTGRPLIVSVSGDGGYNEVVDGVMQAGNDHAVCAVKAAGNATTTAEPPLAARMNGSSEEPRAHDPSHRHHTDRLTKSFPQSAFAFCHENDAGSDLSVGGEPKLSHGA